MYARCKRRRLCPAVMALLLLYGTAGASEGERRELGAHEHGHGLLSVAVDGNDLVIELEIPAMNVVGFEHAPETGEQRHAVEEAVDTFRRGNTLFVPSEGAACSIENIDVALAGMSHDEHEGQGEGHDHGEKNEHEHDGHSELHGEYHFRCAEPGALHSLEVRLFEHLKGMEELEVQIVTPTQQFATELARGSVNLKLDRD